MIRYRYDVGCPYGNDVRWGGVCRSYRSSSTTNMTVCMPCWNDLVADSKITPKPDVSDGTGQ